MQELPLGLLVPLGAAEKLLQQVLRGLHWSWFGVSPTQAGGDALGWDGGFEVGLGSLNLWQGHRTLWCRVFSPAAGSGLVGAPAGPSLGLWCPPACPALGKPS